MSTPSAPPVQDTLEWEQQHRFRTALAAIIGGNFVLWGGVGLGLVLNGVPRVGVLDGVRAAAGQPLSVGEGLRTAQLQFYDDRAFGLLASYVGQAIGALLTSVALGYLYNATKARRAELPRMAFYMAVAGPVLLAVSLLALGFGFTVEVHDFVTTGDFSTKAAHDALNSGLLLAAPLLHTLAGLTVALGFVMVSLNAMRAGLVTRFMGVLGVIVGALFILPLGSSFAVQGFWMIAYGFMLLGRYPGGMPPAWHTGRAEPWPTQQQLREQRGEAPAKAVPAAESAPSDEPAEPKTTPHSSSKKKKRKRR